MKTHSHYSTKFNRDAYSEKIPGAALKEFFTGKKEPLNILYIQGLDGSFDATKKMSREHLDERVRSGEIKVKDLDGGSAEDKLRALEHTLLKSRQEGRINNATQIILSCKPGENPGELNIGGELETEVWKIKDVINTIRGGKTDVQIPSKTDFHGAIHIFGHDHSEFNLEDRKKFGNVLMHASGKFNWSHHHAFMIGHIVNASLNVKNGDAEEITKQVRDAIQPYAGYPIYRISNDKVKVKYPTFRQIQDKERVNGYLAAIKNHKSPIDMLISSIERDRANTLRIRLNTGGLGDLIDKNKKDIGSYEKKRLLAALAASKTDQREKLLILTKELGIDFEGVKSKLEVGPTLEHEIIRNLDNLDPEVIGFFCKLGFEVIPDKYLRNFLCKKIERGEFGELIDAYPSLVDRLKGMDGEDVSLFVAAAAKSENCAEMISDLGFADVDFNLMSDNHLKDIVEQFKGNAGQYTRLFDALIKNGLTSLLDYLDTEDGRMYLTCSTLFHESDVIKDDFEEYISNHPSKIVKLVNQSIIEIEKYGNIEPLKFLLECGLDPNIDLGGKFTPLHKLCRHLKPDIEAIKLLLDNGADPTKITYSNDSPLDLLGRNEFCSAENVEQVFDLIVNADFSAIDDFNSNNLRLVHRAAAAPAPVLLEILLRKIPGYANDDSGLYKMNPLHCAIVAAVEAKKSRTFNKTKFDEVLRLLLEHGVDLSAESEEMGHPPDQSRKTAMDYIKDLKGYEDYDLEKMQNELLSEIGAMSV